MYQSTEQTLELQKVELDIFKIFIGICEKLEIKYYLIAGTLLGAVRHNGFIPWDDDIDVGLVREDYERFISEAPGLLPDHIFLQTNKTDPQFPHVYAKLRNENTTFIECSVKDNKMSHGVFIDVFPLDRCDPNKLNSRVFRLKKKIYSMRRSSLFKNDQLDVKRRLIRLACKIICPSSNAAIARLDKLYRSMPDGKYLVNFSGIYGKREIMPTEWYEDGVQLQFEDVKAVVPKEYDKWLTQVYGDYMTPPPVEKRGIQHQVHMIDTETSYKKYI